MDDARDLNETRAVPAGGIIIHPAGAIHYDATKEVRAIVEIRGMGPVTTTQAN